MIVTVAEDQLSLAIGKKGQNVRLAAKLTGWKIDIKSRETGEVKEAADTEKIKKTKKKK
jgi:N utilization substance protein A